MLVVCVHYFENESNIEYSCIDLHRIIGYLYCMIVSNIEYNITSNSTGIDSEVKGPKNKLKEESPEVHVDLLNEIL